MPGCDACAAIGADVGDASEAAVGEMTPERTDDGPLEVELDVAAGPGLGMGDSRPAATPLPLSVSLLRTAPAMSCIRPIFPNASRYRFNASLDSSKALLPCPSVVMAMAS